MSNEALRLADALQSGTFVMHLERDNTAEELRRLYEENQILVKALQLMTERFLDVDWNHGTYEREAMYKAYETLAKARGESNA